MAATTAAGFSPERQRQAFVWLQEIEQTVFFGLSWQFLLCKIRLAR